MTVSNYSAFLARKQATVPTIGVMVATSALSPLLFPFQADIVQWALRQGRAAIFAERGLGKTFMQVAWADHVVRHTGGKVLIVCPLAVAHQTISEAAKLSVGVTYVRSQADIDAAITAITITNYDMLLREVFDPSTFVGVVLDESSKLKTFTSTTKQLLIRLFADIPFRLAATATPSPNDITELGNHAEFLGVMTSGEMLTRWFIRDSNDANNLRLKGHAVKDFWRWVASWAVCVGKPSDLNPAYDDTGYDLPPLHLQYACVAVNYADRWAQNQAAGHPSLLVDHARSATALWGEKRATLTDRATRTAAIVATEPNEPWIIWHDTDYERDAIRAAIPGVTTVTGSQTPAEKETRLQAFTDGQVRIMSTKPRIGGWGLNWQHCSHMVFMGVTHKFEELYQALGRCHRFGQTRPVHAYIVYAESEASVVDALKTKWEAHEAMRREMVAAMRMYGLAGDATRTLDEHEAVTTIDGGRWSMQHGDCVRAIRAHADNSIHLSVSSWPFSDQYMYSPSLADMGNCDNDAEFFTQMDYLLPELLRVTIPGRMAVVHAKDRIVYGTKNNGYSYIQPFSDDCIRAMTKHGWLFQGRYTVATDPVRENAQTNRLGHGELQKDATRIGCGMPEYLLVFRKPHTATAKGGTWSDAPVDSLTSVKGYSLPRWQVDANSLWRSSGNRLLLPWEQDVYDYHAHIRHLEAMDERHELGRANGERIPTDHPAILWDIDRTNVLNARMAREQQDERHICPLQLDLVERCIVRWSNPGDTVLDYFAGIGTVPYVALQLNRRGLGMELKQSYFATAVRYLGDLEFQQAQPTLFDVLEAA